MLGNYEKIVVICCVAMCSKNVIRQVGLQKYKKTPVEVDGPLIRNHTDKSSSADLRSLIDKLIKRDSPPPTKRLFLKISIDGSLVAFVVFVGLVAISAEKDIRSPYLDSPNN
ncbi:hypothetical protein PPL_09382 [Heterostelium album PN500]|uniref:Uncharacterized protein n=1 Tax=Heterostelium pallidum (strain ATCC 26659 / Pp 5 / PN500) TaxID=670386 RepID=D3BLE8_HETP5|nr:hypothetical protein PPL_09382 [Heterostelium album PN500]EFA77882.1 hypothetical protein PPL_09382 [Heterostelium album PN500]|eukprot:XP_020430010.1 hypothetical protein PPL_09382 [Heterostelium album PN500]